MKINLGWGFNFLQMQSIATDQTFSPLEDTSLVFILETNTVGKLERAGSAGLKLSEQEHFLSYAEAENSWSFKFCMLLGFIETHSYMRFFKELIDTFTVRAISIF